MSHRNARTTFEGRKLIVDRHRAGWPQAHIAAAMGVSRKCVKGWLDRFEAEGQDGLQDRSSRPHSMRLQTGPETEDTVAADREHRQGRDLIAARTGVPARTVSRILARRGLPALSMLDPITGQVIRASKVSAVRYERDEPGDLVHMDVKKLGRIPGGGGWKAHGRANREATKDRTLKIGFDYVHSLVDDHSRLAYTEVLADEKGPTCADFLERALNYFADRGIPSARQLMTDNAWAYT